MPRLLFADDRGTVYDHPELLAAVRTGDAIVRPRERPLPLPEGATLCTLPGRRPVGLDPATGAARVLHEVKVGRRRIVPHAVGATLPPGYTRTLLPAAARPPLATLEDDAHRSRSGPTPPPRSGRTARWCSRSTPTGAATGSPGRHSTPDLPAHGRAAGRAPGTPSTGQLARCALEWRCFTAQNTFYARDEGAIPSSASCNAACVGCLSEQDEGMPPSSHERIARPPTAEEMADVAVRHLESRAPAR